MIKKRASISYQNTRAINKKYKEKDVLKNTLK
jgi:hypothetical protein